jgi:hypothetical protein
MACKVRDEETESISAENNFLIAIMRDENNREKE